MIEVKQVPVAVIEGEKFVFRSKEWQPETGDGQFSISLDALDRDGPVSFFVSALLVAGLAREAAEQIDAYTGIDNRKRPIGYQGYLIGKIGRELREVSQDPE